MFFMILSSVIRRGRFGCPSLAYCEITNKELIRLSSLRFDGGGGAHVLHISDWILEKPCQSFNSYSATTTNSHNLKDCNSKRNHDAHATLVHIEPVCLRNPKTKKKMWKKLK